MQTPPHTKIPMIPLVQSVHTVSVAPQALSPEPGKQAGPPSGSVPQQPVGQGIEPKISHGNIS